MWHPNVYDDGRVCISILHSAGDDPMGYETAAERWSPVHTVRKKEARRDSDARRTPLARLRPEKRPKTPPFHTISRISCPC